MRFAPFEESDAQGQPLWRLQVEAPEEAAAGRHELAWRVLDYPDGPLLCLALRVYLKDTTRPLLFHHALLLNSPAYAKLRSFGGAVLIFERHGFMSDGRAVITLPLGPIEPAANGELEVLARYVENYRLNFPKFGEPEKVWDAIEAELAAPKPKVGNRRDMAWVLGFAALLLTGAVVVWYFYIKPR